MLILVLASYFMLSETQEMFSDLIYTFVLL
jgi:hypothetical protein